MKVLLALLMASCAATSAPSLEHIVPEWTALHTGSSASLRGISVGKDGTIWAGGSDGTILRSTNQGQAWEAVGPDDPDADYRDVEGLDRDRAFAIRITEPAQIIGTQDGGDSWQVLYESDREESFFDSIALFEGGGGVVFGDPQDGVFEVLRSDDGVVWNAVPADQLPQPKVGEAAFAASGTCVAALGDRVWIGTGGQAARVIRSSNRGKTWKTVNTAIRQNTGTAGIYSVAFRDNKHGIVIGGDYTQPRLGGMNAAITEDGGKTWLPPEVFPQGYRSSVAPVPGLPRCWVAVGREGCDYSIDDGRQWLPTGTGLDDSRTEVTGYFALAFGSNGIGYAVGPEGRAARVELKERLPGAR